MHGLGTVHASGVNCPSKSASVTTIFVCWNEHRQKQNQKARKSSRGAVGDRDRKKGRTAWKGGKQFHANKGWTIGELSVSPPPSVALPLSLTEPGQSFLTGIKQGEGSLSLSPFFFTDYWMLFEAFPKGWSYSEKGFLFLWCSSIIHRPFYGLV